MDDDTLTPDEAAEKKRAAQLEKYRRYNERHREERREYNREYNRSKRVAPSLEVNRAYQRRWREANPDKARAKGRENYWRDPEKYRALCREWAKANPEIKRAQLANRRRRIEQQMPAWVSAKEIYTIYKNCPPGMQVDHIVPLNGKTVEGYRVNGLHVPWNLAYLTPFENNSKHNRMRPEDHALAEAPVIASPRQLSLFDD